MKVGFKTFVRVFSYALILALTGNISDVLAAATVTVVGTTSPPAAYLPGGFSSQACIGSQSQAPICPLATNGVCPTMLPDPHHPACVRDASGNCTATRMDSFFGSLNGNNGRIAGSSKVAAGDSVLVWAVKDPTNPTPQCYSITNNSPQTLFLPWNEQNLSKPTYREFSQFVAKVGITQVGTTINQSTLYDWTKPRSSWPIMQNVSVGPCCPPFADQVYWPSTAGAKPGSTVYYNPSGPASLCGCPIGVPIAGSQYNQVNHYGDFGVRWLGVQSGQYSGLPSTSTTAQDEKYWGAEGDVFGPVQSRVCIHDSNGVCTGGQVNAEATFVCSGGAWIQTHAQSGSCGATLGACAGNFAAGSVIPALPTTQEGIAELCSSSSIEEDPNGVQLHVTGSGTPSDPFRWQCAGTVGQPVPCLAELPSNGTCGSANGGAFSTAPTTNLCGIGTASSVTLSQDKTQYIWTCSGIGTSDGASTASCFANNDATAGTCGTDGSSSSPYPSSSTTPVNLCAAGNISSNFRPVLQANGLADWQWTCTPTGSNRSVNCLEYNSNPAAACGTATTLDATSKPTDNLCASGDVLISSPTWNGYLWTWQCGQAGGGTSVNCTADDSQSTECGDANFKSFASAPTSKLCTNGGTATTPMVSTSLSGGSTSQGWTWTCSNSVGTDPYCQAFNANPIINGQCGSANGQKLSNPPSGSQLCSDAESPPAVSGTGATNSPWSWTCVGSNGGTPSPCSATLLSNTDGVCGSANGGTFNTEPTTGLCGDGETPSVLGDGSAATPWTWTCPSPGGGNSSKTCTAYQTTAIVNGTCGSGANLTVSTPVDDGQCATGNPSATTVISATSPISPNSNGTAWQWTCQGVGASSTSQTCTAYECNSCSGTITTVRSASRAGNSAAKPTCLMTGTATWNEVDQLSSQATTPSSITWTDDIGSFSYSPGSSTFVNACPSCYYTVQSVSNAQTTITHATPNCPSSEAAGQTVPAGTVTVH